MNAHWLISFYKQDLLSSCNLEDESHLKGMAESFLFVITVFLALQLAAIGFFVQTAIDLHKENEVFDLSGFLTGTAILGTVMITTAMVSLGSFLVARDSRFKRVSRDKVLVIGVIWMTISLISSSLAAAIGASDLLFGCAFYFGHILPTGECYPYYYILIPSVSLILIYYPFLYHRYIHRK